MFNKLSTEYTQKKFLAAVKAGHLVKVEKYIATSSVLLKAQDELGNTALHLAAERGHKAHFDIIRHLIKAGIDMQKKNGKNLTADYVAVINGHEDIAAYLSKVSLQPDVALHAKAADISADTELSDEDRNQPVVGIHVARNYLRKYSTFAAPAATAEDKGLKNLRKLIALEGDVHNKENYTESNHTPR